MINGSKNHELSLNTYKFSSWVSEAVQSQTQPDHQQMGQLLENQHRREVFLGRYTFNNNAAYETSKRTHRRKTFTHKHIPFMFGKYTNILKKAMPSTIFSKIVF